MKAKSANTKLGLGIQGIAGPGKAFLAGMASCCTTDSVDLGTSLEMRMTRLDRVKSVVLVGWKVVRGGGGECVLPTWLRPAYD